MHGVLCLAGITTTAAAAAAFAARDPRSQSLTERDRGYQASHRPFHCHVILSIVSGAKKDSWR